MSDPDRKEAMNIYKDEALQAAPLPVFLAPSRHYKDITTDGETIPEGTVMLVTADYRGPVRDVRIEPVTTIVKSNHGTITYHTKTPHAHGVVSEKNPAGRYCAAPYGDGWVWGTAEQDGDGFEILVKGGVGVDYSPLGGMFKVKVPHVFLIPASNYMPDFGDPIGVLRTKARYFKEFAALNTAQYTLVANGLDHGSIAVNGPVDEDDIESLFRAANFWEVHVSVSVINIHTRNPLSKDDDRFPDSAEDAWSIGATEQQQIIKGVRVSAAHPKTAADKAEEQVRERFSYSSTAVIKEMSVETIYYEGLAGGQL